MTTGCEFDPVDASQRFCHVGYGANKVGTVSQHTQAKMIVIIGLSVGRVVECAAACRMANLKLSARQSVAGRNMESTRLNSRFSSIKLLGNHRSSIAKIAETGHVDMLTFHWLRLWQSTSKTHIRTSVQDVIEEEKACILAHQQIFR